MKNILFIILTFASINSFAQTCNCQENFQWAKKTFEENDAGYGYTIDLRGKSEYEVYTAKYQEKVKNVSDKSECAQLISEWLAFFRKGHIGFAPLASESNQGNHANQPAPSKNKVPKKLNVEDFKKHLSTKKQHDYEGIWESDAYKIALKKNNGRLEAHVIETSNTNWDVSHLKFLINPDLSGIYYMGDYSEKHFKKAEVTNDVLMELDGLFFKRTFPVGKNQDSEINLFLEIINAEEPFIRLMNENTYLLRIPSFTTDQKPKIDSLIKAYQSRITSTQNLIIDLRGNGGGANKSFDALLPLIYTNPIQTISWEHLSTELNNKRWKGWLENPDITEENRSSLLKVNEKLENNLGKFVNIYDNNGVEAFEQKEVFAFPQNVAVLIDENNASATEQFLLSAKQSKKVKLFGHKTFGALDISEVNEIESPDKNFVLYYCLTKSLRLPELPIDGYGIQPDYFIPKAIPNYKWIDFVVKNFFGK